MIKFFVAISFSTFFAIGLLTAQQQNLPPLPMKVGKAGDGYGKVALTFDCAQWGDKGLEHILEVMIRRRVQGAFFCTGKFLEVNRKGLQKIVEAGFEVANHSYEHDRKNSIAECNRVSGIYESVTGLKMAPYFRAPYLYEEEISWPYYAKNGWLEGYVSIITCDSLVDFKYISDAEWLSNFTHYVEKGSYRRLAIHQVYKVDGPGHINGSSILMHIDGYRWHLLEQMIDILHARGYICTTHSEAFEARKKGDPFKNGKPSKPWDPFEFLGEEPPLPVAPVVASADNFSSPLTPDKTLKATPGQDKSAVWWEQDPKPEAAKLDVARKAFADHRAKDSDNSVGKLSFTFDCSEYSPLGLNSILTTLQEQSVQSTFYITKEYLSKYPGAVKMILENGHEIAPRAVGGSELSVADLDAFATLFKEKTGEKMVKLVRVHDHLDEDTDWDVLSEGGWERGYISLVTGDVNDDWRYVGDNLFKLYFKVYLSVAPMKQANIVNLPIPEEDSSGVVDGGVVQMHPSGYRYHLLGDMIKHVRSEHYSIVPQSQQKPIELTVR